MLLFSYHTSTNASSGSSVVAQGETADRRHGIRRHRLRRNQPTARARGPSTASGTYTGDAISTRFGDVQVEITVEDGRITASRVTRVPWSDHRDQEINAVAVPVLNEEAVEAQSADIDMVSGATYTSEGYIASLQSAIDQANL